MRSILGAGVFVTQISCAPEDAEEVYERAMEVYKTAHAEGVTEAELRQAKNKVRSQLVLSSERPARRLFAVGGDWVYRREYRSLENDLDLVAAITLDEVAAVLKRYSLCGRHDALDRAVSVFTSLARRPICVKPRSGTNPAPSKCAWVRKHKNANAPRMGCNKFWILPMPLQSASRSWDTFLIPRNGRECERGLQRRRLAAADNADCCRCLPCRRGPVNETRNLSGMVVDCL